MSSDAVAEAAPSTSDTTAPDASVETAAMKLTSAAGSSSKICRERRASTHLFDPGTVVSLEVRYYNSSWPIHGSSSSSSNTAVTAAATAAAAAATTPPATTTHGGKQPMLEHCCDPLIRGKDAVGVRGGAKRFSVWISLLTAVKHGPNTAWRATGFVLRVNSWLLFGFLRLGNVTAGGLLTDSWLF